VVLAVEDQREGAALRQMLGHQSRDGLIRVEIGLLPEQPDACAESHGQQDDELGDPEMISGSRREPAVRLRISPRVITDRKVIGRARVRGRNGYGV